MDAKKQFDFEQWMTQFEEAKQAKGKAFSIDAIGYNKWEPREDHVCCGKLASMLYGPFYRWNFADGKHKGYQWKVERNSDPNPDKAQGFYFTNLDGLSTALRMKNMSLETITLHSIHVEDSERVCVRTMPRFLSAYPWAEGSYVIEAMCRNVTLGAPIDFPKYNRSGWTQDVHIDRVIVPAISAGTKQACNDSKTNSM